MHKKSLITVILIFGTIMFLSNQVVAVYGNGNWLYRKLLPLTGSSGAGTNYQVKILVGESAGTGGTNVNVDGHSLSASIFDDVRFTDNDGDTELSYWRESVTGSNPDRGAIFWVKVKDNLDTNQSIYIYYGNSIATSASSGANMFESFDDYTGVDGTEFIDSDYNVTNIGTPPPKYSAGYTSSSPTSLHIEIGLNNLAGVMRYDGRTINNGEILEYDVYHKQDDITRWPLQSFIIGIGREFMIFYGDAYNSSSVNSLCVRHDGVWQSAVNFNLAGFIHIKFIKTTGKYRLQAWESGSDRNGSPTIDWEYGTTDVSSYKWYPFDSPWNDNYGHLYFDNLLVRKYVSTEPTPGAPGSEEDAALPGAITNLAATQGANEGEIKLNWTAVGDDGYSNNITGGKYRIKYSTDTNYSFCRLTEFFKLGVCDSPLL